MVAVANKESVTMTEANRKAKRVSISKQRQLTVPKEYYDALRLTNEAIIEFTGKEIVIRPAEQENVDFSQYILEDLIKQGYEGENLLQEFKRVKENIPRALDLMVRDTLDRPVITGDLDDYFNSLEDSDENE